MFVWGAAQKGIPPEINVIGTIMFVVALAAVLVGEVGSRRRAGRMA
jgi:spermidine/putrescine transport system permease protein